MELKDVRLEIKDYIATVTIDRPPVNALTREMQDSITRCFDMFMESDDVRVAILTGAGKIFCGGLDIKARAAKQWEPGEVWGQRRSWRECTYSIMECRKPVVAAINGPALGAGLAFAASCDILIASSTAQMGLPEINVGMLGGARRAMRLFGHSKVRRMMYTGYRVPAEELEKLGVVECVVPPEALMDKAMEIATEIASKSPIAIKLAKLAVNTIEDMTIRDGYRFEQEMTNELNRHKDSQEAHKAFLEARKPEYDKK